MKNGVNFDNFISVATTYFRTKKDIYNVYQKLYQNTDIVLTATNTHLILKNMIYIKDNKPSLINRKKLNKKVPNVFDFKT